jgi:hypothetical protein
MFLPASLKCSVLWSVSECRSLSPVTFEWEWGLSQNNVGLKQTEEWRFPIPISATRSFPLRIPNEHPTKQSNWLNECRPTITGPQPDFPVCDSSFRDPNCFSEVQSLFLFGARTKQHNLVLIYSREEELNDGTEGLTTIYLTKAFNSPHKNFDWLSFLLR